MTEMHKLFLEYEDIRETQDMIEAIQGRIYGSSMVIPLEEKDRLSVELYNIRQELEKYAKILTEKIDWNYVDKELL